MGEFLYGAGYYPLFQTRDEWMEDLDTMQKCGINIIRTAELFNTWDRIEPEPDCFVFDWLDEFFDECYRRGMTILLGTGTASPPNWLRELDEDVNIISATGKKFPNNVTYSWACMHNPTYLERSEIYIRTLVERYKNHPALHSYQIHNEIGLPFMSVGGNEVEMYCYCEHSKAAFREWVQEKYQTLDAVNHAWTWSATNSICTRWDQIEPPYAKPTSWASVTKYLDFRLFMMDTITGFVGWQNKMIKEMDDKHLTSTNIFYMKGEDKMSVMIALDQFEIAKQVDVVGYDLYPGSGNKLEARPEFSSMFLDHARSISKPLGKPYWLLEVESGPINGWAMGPHRNTSGDDIYRYIMEAVGHDSKFTLYQGFRQWDFQPLNWGGLVDLDGKWTARCDAAAEAGAFLKRNGAYLNEAKTNKGQVALLVSKENAIIVNGMGHESELVRAISATYRIFWGLGYSVDFITPELLANGYAKDYKAIATPFLLSVSEKLAKDLADYAKQGGIVFGGTRMGYVNEQGWYNHHTPVAQLADVFGVETICVEKEDAPVCTYGRCDYKGYGHRETIAVASQQANCKARFFDDAPAVVTNVYGDGLGVYFATHADGAFLQNGSTLMMDVVADVLKSHGVLPEVEVWYSNRLNREIDCHLLRGAEKDFAIFTVFTKKDRKSLLVGGKKHVEVSVSVAKEPVALYEENTQTPVLFTYSNGRISFAYDMVKKGACLVIVY